MPQRFQVTLLEKMSGPGRKLSITGKGRCNSPTALARTIHRRLAPTDGSRQLATSCRPGRLPEPGNSGRSGTRGRFSRTATAPQTGRSAAAWAAARSATTVIASVSAILTKSAFCGSGRARQDPRRRRGRPGHRGLVPETGSTGDGYAWRARWHVAYPPDSEPSRPKANRPAPGPELRGTSSAPAGRKRSPA
jgi:hypothetical protein